jgi:hypothetical protein
LYEGVRKKDYRITGFLNYTNTLFNFLKVKCTQIIHYPLPIPIHTRRYALSRKLRKPQTTAGRNGCFVGAQPARSGCILDFYEFYHKDKSYNEIPAQKNAVLCTQSGPFQSLSYLSPNF